MPIDDRADRRVLPFPTDRTKTGVDRAMHRYPVPLPIRAYDSADLPTPFPPRRAAGSAASFQERTAMNSLHVSPNLHFAHAEFRRQEMLAEAERARHLARVAPAAPRRAFGLAARQRLGAAMVRAGQRLQGAGAAEPADAFPAVGSLRVVR